MTITKTSGPENRADEKHSFPHFNATTEKRGESMKRIERIKTKKEKAK